MATQTTPSCACDQQYSRLRSLESAVIGLSSQIVTGLSSCHHTKKNLECDSRGKSLVSSHQLIVSFTVSLSTVPSLSPWSHLQYRLSYRLSHRVIHTIRFATSHCLSLPLTASLYYSLTASTSGPQISLERSRTCFG